MELKDCNLTGLSIFSVYSKVQIIVVGSAECLTRDRGAAGSSLTGFTELCP